MIAYIEVPEEVTRLDILMKELAGTIAESITAVGRKEHLSTNTDLFSLTPEGWAIIQNGVFKFFFNSRLVRLYSTGDILPIIPEHRETGCTCTSEFGAEVHIVNADECNRHLASTPSTVPLFIRYLSLHTTMMHILCSAFMTDELHPELTIKEYRPGEIIIAQGAPALEIYQMIQGEAIVTVDGIEVGAVAAGEVFGEISFFTESTRSATVTAKNGCMVQCMGKDDFIDFTTMKPSVNFAISKTLSQRLMQTNKKITEE